MFSINGKISRQKFALTGIVLFILKYNIDRLIALLNNRSWYITNYFIEPDHLSVSNLSSADQRFYLLIAVISVPFIWLGTVLCMKRLKDANLPLWLVIIFFIPLINILFFFILCVLPTGSGVTDIDHKPGFLNSIIPKTKTGSILFSIGVTSFIALIFSLLSINILGEYGWGLFLGIPFFISFATVLLYSYHHYPITAAKAVAIGCTSITFFAVLLICLAVEGVICLLMAAPIAYAIGFIASLLAYAIQSYSPRSSLNSIAIQILIVPVILILEKPKNELPVYELKTAIVINSPPEKVWNHLVNFSAIAPPEELIFKTGIAYPVNATIEGKGIGAIRKCNFTTGSFIEPITVWDEPNNLRFDVLQQPQPMFELSFYDEIKTIHLDEYFKSVKGGFKLTRLKENKTLLEGTTWYTNKMWPLIYWKQYSDYILHAIHLRVLKHIKMNSEQNDSNRTTKLPGS